MTPRGGRSEPSAAATAGAPIAPRRVGVEEELLLLDPSTGGLLPVGERALRATPHQAADGSGEVEPEMFRTQVETVTEPCLTLDALAAQLREGRRTAGRLAGRAGAAAVAVPTPVLAEGDDDVVTRQPRYERIRQEFGELARTSLVCAMHVHVEVDGRDAGVRVGDSIRPWLPVLLALSANSPYVHGRDTGYASWRTQVWSRWPSAGTGEAFGSAAVYDEVRDALVRWGVAFDEGMLYFDARPSARFPTLEVRVADVCTDLDDAVLVAALTRALVTVAADQDSGSPWTTAGRWRSELLRAATWRASRHGLAGRLVHPTRMELAPAREVVEGLLDLVRPALEAAGDHDRVVDLVERLFAHGGGATRQRRAFETGGTLHAVVADLVART